MPRPPAGSPLGEALSWASRIMAVCLAMVLPAVVGNWLDVRLGTGFLAAVGLVIGFVAGIVWLVQLTARRRS